MVVGVGCWVLGGGLWVCRIFSQIKSNFGYVSWGWILTISYLCILLLSCIYSLLLLVRSLSQQRWCRPQEIADIHTTDKQPVVLLAQAVGVLRESTGNDVFGHFFYIILLFSPIFPTLFFILLHHLLFS